MKKFKFADGMIVSPGDLLATSQAGVHKDPSIYPCPEDFDGFRFSRMKEEGETSKIYTTNTSTEFITFGHGKHAW